MQGDFFFSAGCPYFKQGVKNKAFQVHKSFAVSQASIFVYIQDKAVIIWVGNISFHRRFSWLGLNMLTTLEVPKRTLMFLEIRRNETRHQFSSSWLVLRSLFLSGDFSLAK